MSSRSTRNPRQSSFQLLEKFETFSYCKRLSRFCKYLKAYYKYANEEFSLDWSVEELESTYEMCGSEKDKIEKRLLLLGQLIHNKDLKIIFMSKFVNNSDFDNNDTIYSKIKSLKKTIAGVSSVKDSQYPNLCSFIAKNLRKKLYDSCVTIFSVTTMVRPLVDKYCLNAGEETQKILALPKADIDKLIARLTIRFASTIRKNRFRYFKELGCFWQGVDEVAETNVDALDDKDF
uniref:CLASP_N domain-containing protein n=1 Tax=Parastrongyloides trichosuri TaxID=131310 RepID=A0A0N4Z8M2_PARTI